MFTDENDSIKRHLPFANNPDARRYFMDWKSEKSYLVGEDQMKIFQSWLVFIFIHLF